MKCFVCGAAMREIPVDIHAAGGRYVGIRWTCACAKGVDVMIDDSVPDGEMHVVDGGQLEVVHVGDDSRRPWSAE